jgi:hypothetical protein
MTVTSDRLRKGVSGLARLAALFGNPAVATAIQCRDSPSPVILPQINQALGKLEVVR